MISLSALGAAALAKLVGLKTVVGRFFNGSAVAAIAIALAVAGAAIGGVWLVNRIESGAVAEWQARYSLARWVATLRERKQQRDADARAAAERQVLVEQIRETAAHAAALEQELARLADNPVVYPEPLAKELRK